MWSLVALCCFAYAAYSVGSSPEHNGWARPIVYFYQTASLLFVSHEGVSRAQAAIMAAFDARSDAVPGLCLFQGMNALQKTAWYLAVPGALTLSWAIVAAVCMCVRHCTAIGVGTKAIGSITSPLLGRNHPASDKAVHLLAADARTQDEDNGTRARAAQPHVPPAGSSRSLGTVTVVHDRLHVDGSRRRHGVAPGLCTRVLKVVASQGVGKQLAGLLCIAMFAFSVTIKTAFQLFACDHIGQVNRLVVYAPVACYQPWQILAMCASMAVLVPFPILLWVLLLQPRCLPRACRLRR